VTAPADPGMSVELALADLRRSVDVGNAMTQGKLDLIAQRADQTDRQLDDHEQRLDALERSRWPIASVGVLTGLGGLAIALWQASGH
jgi:cytolysin (calcineurin-like family phosphatase)